MDTVHNNSIFDLCNRRAGKYTINYRIILMSSKTTCQVFMRLFFALWPPTEAAEQLSGIAQSAARQFGGKPTRQETIHLTLAFLGEVPEEQLPLLEQTARIVRAAPFMLNIDCLGYWRRNHLLWAGSDSPCIALAELVENLQSALTDAGFTVADRDRTFTPHITLIRKVPEAREPFAL